MFASLTYLSLIIRSDLWEVFHFGKEKDSKNLLGDILWVVSCGVESNHVKEIVLVFFFSYCIYVSFVQLTTNQNCNWVKITQS